MSSTTSLTPTTIAILSTLVALEVTQDTLDKWLSIETGSATLGYEDKYIAYTCNTDDECVKCNTIDQLFEELHECNQGFSDIMLNGERVTMSELVAVFSNLPI